MDSASAARVLRLSPHDCFGCSHLATPLATALSPGLNRKTPVLEGRTNPPFPELAAELASNYSEGIEIPGDRKRHSPPQHRITAQQYLMPWPFYLSLISVRSTEIVPETDWCERAIAVLRTIDVP